MEKNTDAKTANDLHTKELFQKNKIKTKPEGNLYAPLLSETEQMPIGPKVEPVSPVVQEPEIKKQNKVTEKAKKEAETKAKEEERAAKKKQKEEERKEKKETLKAELKLKVATMKARETRFCKAMSGIAKELFRKKDFKEELQINAHKKYQPRTFGLAVGVPGSNIFDILAVIILNMMEFIKIFMEKNISKLILKALKEPIKSEEEVAKIQQRERALTFKNIGFMQNRKEWAKVNKVTDDDLIPEEIPDNPKLKKNAADKGLKPMIGVTAVNDKSTVGQPAVSKKKEQDGVGI